MAARLKSGQNLSAFILMQRIRPPLQRAMLVRGGLATEEDTVSELGIYGAFVATAASGVVMNDAVGHLLRTKMASSDEGGVAAGFAVLDSPYLCKDPAAAGGAV